VEARTRLQEARRAQGFSQETFAEQLGASVAAVRDWEQGRRTPQPGTRHAMARALDVSLPELRFMLDGTPPRPQPNGKQSVPGWLTLYASLEQGAASLWSWQPVTVHALLQTADYAASVEHTGLGATDTAVAELVALRIGRQGVLTREEDPLQLSVVLDESVLLRVTGGRRVMAGQLRHLLDIGARANVQLQVLPLDFGVHTGSFGAFTMLALPGTPTPQTVCVEDRTGQRYLEGDAVEAHHSVFDHLSACALSMHDSAQLIRNTLEGRYT
jgi:transcriptional regulator with XRE-family HTH domain